MTNSSLLYFEDESEAKKILLIEGRKLKNIAQMEWAKYLNSYSPVEYIRTHDSEKALKLGIVKVVNSDHLGIEVTWDNTLVYHDSWLYKKGKAKKNVQGHSIMLISKGWHSKKLEKVYGKRVYRHTYYQGYGYIDNVIRAYENVKDPRIHIELQWSGVFYK